LTHNAERMKREMPESEVLAGIINHGEHREKQKHNHEGHEEPKEKKHLTADGRRQTQTTRTSPGSKKMSCLRMRISRLIIIRKQHYSEPDDSGSTAPRLASRCSLSDLIVDIRRRVQLFDLFDRLGVNFHGRLGETRRSIGKCSWQQAGRRQRSEV